MVPGPVQAAVAVAYNDDEHVNVQRERYLARLSLMSDALKATRRRRPDARRSLLSLVLEGGPRRVGAGE
jgi:aspartate/methionine/tyrosine aminotransferase